MAWRHRRADARMSPEPESNMTPSRYSHQGDQRVMIDAIITDVSVARPCLNDIPEAQKDLLPQVAGGRSV